MKEKNLKIVLEEVSDLLRNQQEGIDLLYNKLNWILVSNVVLLSALFASDCPNLVVGSFLVISIVITLVGFSPKTFKVTAKISDQLRLVDEAGFLVSLINKKRQAFLSNNKKLKRVHLVLRYASGCLICAIVLQFIVIYV